MRVPEWDAVVLAGVARPDLSKGVFENVGALSAALLKWDSKRWRNIWSSAVAVKAELKLDDATLARGSVVYRQWCIQCHGLTGAGEWRTCHRTHGNAAGLSAGDFQVYYGVSAAWSAEEGIEPKRKASSRGSETGPSATGLVGSMMPAFSTLLEEELEDLISYVIHLSIRGETEFSTMRPIMEDPDIVGPELEWLFVQNFLSVVDNWGSQRGVRFPFRRNARERMRTDCFRRSVATSITIRPSLVVPPATSVMGGNRRSSGTCGGPWSSRETWCWACTAVAGEGRIFTLAFTAASTPAA